MKYQILEPFRVKTHQGEMELLPGQFITLPDEKALDLITAGKIFPLDRVAYRLYSNVLQAYLWVIAD